MADMGGNQGNRNEPSCNSRQKKQVQQKRVKQQQNTAAAAGGRVSAEPKQQQQHNQDQNHPVHPSSFAQNQMLKKAKLEGMIPEDLVHRAEEERTKARMQQRERAQTHPQEQQRKNHLIQQHQFDDAKCINKLHEYNFYMQKGLKLQDNPIDYWRKFVSLFYAEYAREKWCVSSYRNTGEQMFGGFSFSAMEPWSCNICGTKSGKGFGASFEILPRLCQMRLASGEVDHSWQLKNPRVCRVRPDVVMIEHKATLESIYERFRVIREGKLWVTFRDDLKIVSWEFCSHGHEELFPRRFIAPQVNQFIDVANDYQKSIYDLKHGKATEEQLQENGNLFLKCGHMLSRYVESPLINDLGFSAKHVRCLEIAKVVNTMKGLIDFSVLTKTGPIESLRIYPRARSNMPMPENQETAEMQNPQTDGIRSMAGNSTQYHPNSLYNNGGLNGENVGVGSGQDRSVSVADYIPKHLLDQQLTTMGGAPPHQGGHGNLMLNRVSGPQACDASKIAQQLMIDQSFDAAMAEIRGSSVQSADLGDVQVDGGASINVTAK